MSDHKIIEFYRSGLALGLVSVSEIVTWADNIILREPTPPPVVLDLAIVSQDDRPAALSHLRELSPTVDEDAPLSSELARALLDRIRADMLTGRRDLPETIGLVVALRGLIAVEDPLWDRIMMIEADYDLAEDRLAGDLATVERETKHWLAQFEGEADRFVRRGA